MTADLAECCWTRSNSPVGHNKDGVPCFRAQKTPDIQKVENGARRRRTRPDQGGTRIFPTEVTVSVHLHSSSGQGSRGRLPDRIRSNLEMREQELIMQEGVIVEGGRSLQVSPFLPPAGAAGEWRAERASPAMACFGRVPMTAPHVV
jgi:hypothetical protein